MTETTGAVVGAEGDLALDGVEVQTGCGCWGGVSGCSTGSRSRMFRVRPRRFRLLNRAGPRPGERVVPGACDGALLRSAGAAAGLDGALLNLCALGRRNRADPRFQAEILRRS